MTKPPPVNLVLQSEPLDGLRDLVSNEILVHLIRDAIATTDQLADTIAESATIVARQVAHAADEFVLTARDMINASGIIIHTGWGNAPLHRNAIARIAEAAGATGTGGKNAAPRTRLCESLLTELTGAESATVITQNAASYALAAATFAAGKEVVVAARDLVEISNGARILDIVEAGGATVIPVGSANCVHLHDYENAIGRNTAMILRVHVSNMSSTGYVAHVDGSQLAKLANQRELIYLENLGGGSLVDLEQRGLPACPTLQQSIENGADIAFASGDKIIGGPQSGIVVGKKELVDELVRAPMARICRPGKLTLAALEATLQHYVSGRAWDELPVLRLLAMPETELEKRAMRLAGAFTDQGLEATPARDTAECGGAVLPGVMLPTWAVELCHKRLREDELHRELLCRGILGRRKSSAVLIDLRSVLPEDDDQLLARANKL